MRFDFDDFQRNIPEGLSNDFDILYRICCEFRRNSEVYPYLQRKEIFRRISISKEKVLEAIAKFCSVINQNYNPSGKFEVAKKLKFDEDIGEIKKALFNENVIEYMGVASRDPYLNGYEIITKFATIFDFIVYQPVFLTNRKTFSSAEQYIKELFKICSSNAGILGHSERSANKTTQSSRVNLSRAASTLLENYEDGKGEDDEKDDEEKDEDEEKEEDEEKKETPKTTKKILRGRGRPRRRNV